MKLHQGSLGQICLSWYLFRYPVWDTNGIDNRADSGRRRSAPMLVRGVSPRRASHTTPETTQALLAPGRQALEPEQRSQEGMAQTAVRLCW